MINSEKELTPKDPNKPMSLKERLIKSERK